MLVAIIGALLFAICAIGWGHGFWSCLKCLSGKPRDELPIGVLGLMGLFAIANLAVVYNFLSPLDPVFFNAMLAIGAVLALHLGTHSDSTGLRKRASVIAMLVACFGVTALAGMPGYDGGLYHLPHQLWMRSDKIIIGLANLHGRFGFDSILEPLSAAAWLPHNDLRMVQMVPALFKGFFFATLYEEVRFGHRTERSSEYLALALVGGYVLARMILRLANESWAQTDTWPGLSLLLGYYYCLLALHSRNSNDLWLALFFMLFAAEMKISAAFSLPMVLVAALSNFRHKEPRRLPLAEAGLLLMCFLPWLARNTLLSGCLVFPVTITCIPGLPWSSASAAVEHTGQSMAWAREPKTGVVAQGWAWLPLWLTERTRFFINAAIIFGSLTATAVLIGRQASKAGWGLPLVFVVFLAGAIFPLSVWFASAPDLRFAFGPIVMLLVLPGFLYLTTRELRVVRRMKWASLILFLMVPVIWAVQQVIVDYSRYKDYPFFQHRALVLEPPSVRPGEYFGTMPAIGDQCWLAAPGCSPEQKHITEEKLWAFRMFRVVGDDAHR
jgi:hypothetical protein